MNPETDVLTANRGVQLDKKDKSGQLATVNNAIDKLPEEEKSILTANQAMGGGLISVVAGGDLISPIPVAIKHTMENIPLGPQFSPIDARNLLYQAPYTQDVDAKILMILEDSRDINVPRIRKYFRDERVTVMDDFKGEEGKTNGYKNMEDMIKEGDVIASDAAENIGKTMANLRIEMNKMSDFVQEVENPVLQVEEKTEELRLSLYDGRMDYYNWIWANMLDPETAKFTWTDSYPNNIALNKHGEVMVYDFGRSINCDPDYVVPNFAGHIFLSMLGGSIDYNTGMELINGVQKSYEEKLREEEGNENYSLNEQKFVWYSMSEIAHRGKTMRWIDADLMSKIDNHTAREAVNDLIDSVFDAEDPIVTKDRFTEVFKEVVERLHGQVEPKSKVAKEVEENEED